RLTSRKLLLLVGLIASWLSASGYFLHQRAKHRRVEATRQSLWDSVNNRVDQQQSFLLLPPNNDGFPLPDWKSIVKGHELTNNIISDTEYIRLLYARVDRRRDLFDPRFNHTQMHMLIKLFWLVDDFCREHNIVYFMYGSTLIGSYRHHGLVPWDDDIDIMVPIAERDRFVYLLRTRAKHLRLYTWAHHWKLWSPDTTVKLLFRNYGWPFVDLFFYGENSTHILEMDPNYNGLAYKKEHVLPLHYRPFMGRWLPAPRDTAKFLVLTYRDPDGCHSAYFYHDVEKMAKRKQKTRCEMLAKRFPFALKSLPSSTLENGMTGLVETLYISDRPLYSV
uniref:Secreted protein n=1 Tax=Macrostomum lignano TaxID=282301 RepID=A0A1I8G3Z7_9PLAT